MAAKLRSKQANAAQKRINFIRQGCMDWVRVNHSKVYATIAGEAAKAYPPVRKPRISTAADRLKKLGL